MSQNNKQQKEQEKLQREAFREKVVQDELSARANKAQYERMYYYLECRKIVDQYYKALDEDINAAREAQNSKAGEGGPEIKLEDAIPMTAEQIDEVAKANEAPKGILTAAGEPVS